MKKVISIILALVLCLSCCFALAACNSVTPNQAEAAKQSFYGLMDTYNGLIQIYGTEMDITADTTIQDVADFIKNESGQIAVIEYLDPSRPFLGACQKSANGYYYELRTDVDWSIYYKA